MLVCVLVWFSPHLADNRNCTDELTQAPPVSATVTDNNNLIANNPMSETEADAFWTKVYRAKRRHWGDSKRVRRLWFTTPVLWKMVRSLIVRVIASNLLFKLGKDR